MDQWLSNLSPFETYLIAVPAIMLGSILFLGGIILLGPKQELRRNAGSNQEGSRESRNRTQRPRANGARYGKGIEVAPTEADVPMTHAYGRRTRAGRNIMNPKMLTIAIFLLGIPSIGFAQSEGSLPEQQASPATPEYPDNKGAMPEKDAPSSGDQGASGDYDGTPDEGGGGDEDSGDGGDE